MAKPIGLLLLLLGVIHGRMLAQESATTPDSREQKINWPSGYEPSGSKFYVHNEIQVAAPPQVVWEILIDAEAWPAWYQGAKKVALAGEKEKTLGTASVFSWQTMGLKFNSIIKEFVPFTRLSWESKKKSIQGYHAWLIIPTQKGCKVITDESQNGWLTLLEKTFQPKKLYKLHNRWLEQLKKKAETEYQSR
jgi:uncharacterized protein YndB with AHSA1/START domain